MYVVMWLTSPFNNIITQVTTAFASVLIISHLAGVVFEAVAVLGVFAVDLLTGQVLARMDKREKTSWRRLRECPMSADIHQTSDHRRTLGARVDLGVRAAYAGADSKFAFILR